ncbi:MAG: hypothetical protein M5U12_14555 [Verrucomicrobia bacterium]|nr:hypothetical protein [Verrucomicrobiota bacterium]
MALPADGCQPAGRIPVKLGLRCGPGFLAGQDLVGATQRRQAGGGIHV